MQDNMKFNNIGIIEIREGEEEAQGLGNLFEKVMMVNIATLMREKDTQIQEIKTVPNKSNTKRHTARYIWKTHNNQNGKIQRQREDLKGSKGENGSNIQGSPNKISN